MAVLNNVVVWMVSTCRFITKSSNPCINHLVTLPKAPIIIGINVTFHVPQFFQFSSKVKVFVLLFIFFQFYSMVSRDSKVYNFTSIIIIIIIIIIITESNWEI